MCRVSIIMGIYNCASTLSEAIDSILNQTYPDWKMIMCDDGSEDTTIDVAAKYVEKYPEKFILLKNRQNRGLNYTLNYCLKYAEGEFIARMDGDDISLPQRLEKEVDFLDSHPEYDIVSCPMQYFDDNGIFSIGTISGEPLIKNIVKTSPFCHAPCMVRRKAYEAVNGYSIDKKLLRVEDWHLWIKMYSLGYKGFVLNEPLYMMRDDEKAAYRRKFKYRINESHVICVAVKELHFSFLNYIFALRPILVGLLPQKMYLIFHKHKKR